MRILYRHDTIFYALLNCFYIESFFFHVRKENNFMESCFRGIRVFFTPMGIEGILPLIRLGANFTDPFHAFVFGVDMIFQATSPGKDFGTSVTGELLM